jgi:asparaginyl-tRNA synthetase
MIEPEMAFADLRENMEVAEGFVRFVLKHALERHPEEFAYLEDYEKKVLAERKKELEEKGLKAQGKGAKVVRDFKETPLRERMQAIVDANFARCSYTEAIETLQKAIAAGQQFENNNVFWGLDLGSEHERYLAEGLSALPPLSPPFIS